MFFMTLLSLSDAEIDSMFKMMDLNGDGTLDRVEFGKVIMLDCACLCTSSSLLCKRAPRQLMSVLRARSAIGRQLRDRNVLGQSLRRVDHAGGFAQFFGSAGDKKLSLPEFRACVHACLRCAGCAGSARCSA